MTEQIWCCCAYTYFATADYVNRLLDFAWTVFTYFIPWLLHIWEGDIKPNHTPLFGELVWDVCSEYWDLTGHCGECRRNARPILSPGKRWGNKLISQHGCIVQTCRCVARPIMKYSLHDRRNAVVPRKETYADCTCAFVIASGLTGTLPRAGYLFRIVLRDLHSSCSE